MTKILPIFLVLTGSYLFGQLQAATMTLATSSNDYNVVNVFSDVDDFSFLIEIDQPLAPGVYENPPIISVSYQVIGVLASGTPSGFTSFDLRRSMTGVEFYDQGSSLSFEIADFADLSDGVQGDELIDNGFILRFNGREIDNGRFHPALFELNFGGTGRIQNSNNITTLNPLFEVEFGAEYVTDLTFNPDEVTFILETQPVESGGSSGSLSFFWLLLLAAAAFRRQRV